MKKYKALKKLSNTFQVFKKAISNFGSNNPVELSGTTAFFATFSMAPIIIIIISIFGFVVGNYTMREKLFEEVNALLGQESTEVLRNAIQNYQIADESTFGTILGLIFFLVAATTLFSIMQNSINFIWRVKAKSSFKTGILKMLKDRVFSFGMILSLGFVLLISLIIDTLVGSLKSFLSTYFSPDFVILAQLINLAVSIGVVSAVFATIYRFLPDVHVKWSASWFGALFTAVLFSLGKYLIGLVIGNSNVGMVYGTIGAFIGILLWIYYASFIFYFGVELSRQFSLFYKHDSKPTSLAEPFKITTVEQSEVTAEK
ncbi:MAG: YihY/virulence factor BrkB family protein [Bacteroidetes bacterium]|nr:YihY/virulence factor BrkB family protein [Bacteroidota bacterium]